VVDGIELLASLFHPDRTSVPKGARATVVTSAQTVHAG
jgi:hypothetical protein